MIKATWQKIRDKWSTDKKVVVIALIIAAFLLLFVELSEEVLEGETLGVDNFLLTAFRDPARTDQLIGPGWMLTTVQDISSLGGVSVIVLLSTLVGLFFLFRKQWHLLVFYISSVTGGTLAMVLLKSLFNRPRPSIVPHLSHVSLESYPSGHSMVSAIVYLTLGAILARSTKSLAMRMYYLGSACLLTLIIGVSRIMLGVHYPSDVLAGWCAGIVWAGSSYLIAQTLQRKGVIENPGTKGDLNDSAASNDTASNNDAQQ